MEPLVSVHVIWELLHVHVGDGRETDKLLAVADTLTYPPSCAVADTRTRKWSVERLLT